MTLKVLLLGFTALVTVTIVRGQGVRLEAGLNLATFSNTTKSDLNTSMLPGLHFGIKADLPLSASFAFQPGIMYTGKGIMISEVPAFPEGYYSIRTNPHYLELPLNFVYKSHPAKKIRFFAGGGPYLALGIGGRYKIEGDDSGSAFSEKQEMVFDDAPSIGWCGNGAPAYFEQLKRFDYGVNGTVSIERKSTIFSINYGMGLASVLGESVSEYKHRVLSFTFGFKL